jgi:hypothetical protein
MKKDIPQHKVTDIGIAIVPYDETFWEVYLINQKDSPLRNLLVSSRGYGERNGQPVSTTSLRYFFEHIDAQSAVKIEPIQNELFELANEYWISFQLDGYLYDKKYVFVNGSIHEDYMVQLPILETRGVLIR